MAAPESDRVERKVVVKRVSSTTSRSSMAAWIMIAILAVALIVYILTHLR